MIYRFATWLSNLVRDDGTDIFSRLLRLFGKPTEPRQYAALRRTTAEGAELFSVELGENMHTEPKALMLASTIVDVRAGCWVCERARIAVFSAGAALLLVPHTGPRVVGALLLLGLAITAALLAWKRHVDESPKAP